MVIDDFHIIGVAVSPCKANTPLIVDANTVLAFPVAFKSPQTIAWRRRQVSKFRRDIKLTELALRDALEGSKSLDAPPIMEMLRLFRSKGLKHTMSIYRQALNVKRYVFRVSSRNQGGSAPFGL